MVTQVGARTAEDEVVPPVRPLGWQRLCLPSFLVAGLTGLILLVAVDALLEQGRLGTVLAAGVPGVMNACHEAPVAD